MRDLWPLPDGVGGDRYEVFDALRHDLNDRLLLAVEDIGDGENRLERIAR